MPPQTPLLLLDNLFDTVQLYPAASLSATSVATGRDTRSVADYRRERTWWQAASSGANHAIRVDLGVGNSASPDALFLDRGHNLAGVIVELRYSDDDITYTTWISRTVPAAGVTGQDPLTLWSQTEEGASYTLFTAHASPHRYWQVRIPATMTPIITGLILGARTQLYAYSAIYDEDASGRKQRTEESDAGYLATGRTYSWRTCELDLQLIGDTDYDNQVRRLVDLTFRRDQPFVLCMNWGTYPSRAWMFKCDMQRASFPKRGAYRAGRYTGREVGARVT